MEKFIKSDYVFAVILISTWLFYLLYDGSTRFDVNQTITVPLLVAADFTAISILYSVGRYYTAKKTNIVTATLNNMMKDEQTEQTQDNAESDDNKS